MQDLINRQAAIDALMKRDKELRNINWYDKPFAEGECKGIDDALEIINTLPSAQPEVTLDQITEYCYKNCLSIVDNNLLRRLEAAWSKVQQETCEGCKHLDKWENEVEYGYPSPCTRCKRMAEDHYER